MELITISYDERPYGFGKGTPREFQGVKFTNGKIAFVNEQGEIRASESESKLKEALPGAVITLHASRKQRKS